MLAETLLAKAAQLSPGDLDIHEKWQDCQLRNLRQRIAKTKDPDAAKVLRREYFLKDVDFCIAACGPRRLECPVHEEELGG